MRELAAAVLLIVIATQPRLRRWFLGRPLDGHLRTNATWNRRATKVLHPTGYALWWHHWRQRDLAALRTAGTVGVTLTAVGLAVARTETIVILAAGALVLLALHVPAALARSRDWRHHRTWVQPLHRALTYEMGIPPARLVIAPDRSKVVIGLPVEFTGSPGARQAVTQAVTAKLAIEAPDAEWSLDHKDGRKPQVTYTQSEPLPTLVTWEDVKDAVDGCGPDELVVGVGKRGQIIKVSLAGDAAHLGIAMGSGAGKSNLTAFWLLQELRRGAIALILDAKLYSHPWTFKDMDAEFGLLPNVGYARRADELHDALVWAGGELDRRNAVAMRAINAKGRMREGTTVGPRLFIVGEELNIATDRLKDHWAAIREKGDPKRSPALSALSDVSCGGRAAEERLILVAQMLTAASTGGGQARENVGVKAMARYSANSWKMQAGDLPMPPVPEVNGRVQVIASGSVHEVQVPLMDYEQVRELVLAGTITPCPADMPGSSRELLVPGHPHIGSAGPDLGNVVGQGPDVPALPGAVTLREAVAADMWPSIAAARKSVQRAALQEVGSRDTAFLYKISDLAEIKSGRVKVYR